MDIEIIRLDYKPCKRKLACLWVKYYELVFKCDLVYRPQEKKAWLRMPEIWTSPENKMRYCWWDSKEISDEFQNYMLKKIFDNYDLSLEKLEAMHIESMKHYSEKKKTRQDKKK